MPTPGAGTGPGSGVGPGAKVGDGDGRGEGPGRMPVGTGTGPQTRPIGPGQGAGGPASAARTAAVPAANVATASAIGSSRSAALLGDMLVLPILRQAVRQRRGRIEHELLRRRRHRAGPAAGAGDLPVTGDP